MRFGLMGGAIRNPDTAPSDSQAYEKFIDYVLEAEALGFHGINLVEHHFTGFGQVSASLNLLTYLAARTTRIRLGTAVVVVPWHNPILLAEQAATVDLLSNGRLDFGVGRGYRYTEFRGFGLTPEELTPRFDEAMTIIRKAWTATDRFSHHGRYWDFNDVIVEPSPIQQPHPPIWLGAANPDSIRKAARDGYRLFLDQVGTFDETAARLEIYRHEKDRLGIPYQSSDVAAARTIQFAFTPEQRDEQIARRAAAFARLNEVSLSPAAKAGAIDITTRLSPPGAADPRKSAEDASIIGTPEECIERLQRLQTDGFEHILLIDYGATLETLRTFAQEVMPAFAPTT